METGRKWHDNKATIRAMRIESDILCYKHNLSVIEKGSGKAVDQTTYQLAMKGKSWKMQLVADLDLVTKQCNSKLDFIDFMNKHGYDVRYTDTHITFKKHGEAKGIRADTLARQFGGKYTKYSLENAMNIPHSKASYSAPKEEKQGKPYVSEWEKFERYFFKTSAAGAYGGKVGNISYSELTAAYGENFQVKVTAQRLQRLQGQPFFYCVKTLSDGNALVMVKANNREMLTKALGIDDISAVNEQNQFLHNKQIYENIKSEAWETGVDVAYHIVTSEQLQKLKASLALQGNFSHFERDGRINIAFLPKYKERILNLLSPQSQRVETEKQRNFRINNELKLQSMQEGERLCYKIITPEQLEWLKKTDVKFAFFESKTDKEKFNVVYLQSEAEQVNYAVYQQGENIER
jgi:hypothetical protein